MSQDIEAFSSLGSEVNKRHGGDNDENKDGVVSEYLPELSLDMTDEQLARLTDSWEKKWDESPTKADWLKQLEENEKYWKGNQFSKLESEANRPLVDNQIFQSVETFLPAATRQNPEPLVELRATEQKSPENLKYTEIVRNRLSDWGDDVKIRLKIKKAGRHWLISLLGVGKMGWDVTNNRPAMKALRPKKLILDPDGVTDEDGYSGKYVGEYRKMEASTLVLILEDKPDAVQYIKDLVKGDMGTDVQFIEFWTNEYLCWKCGTKILLKKKNPHWNYDVKPEETKQPINQEPSSSTIEPTSSMDGESGPMPATPDQNEPKVDAAPIPSPYAQQGTPGNNHFASPRIPYIFISIFNLGKTPVDETSLITQNLPQQDLINKRERQIDKNADSMNNGLVISEERSGLTKEEAKGVSDAIKKGGTVVIPSGNPAEAVMRLPSQPLPTDVYANLLDTRNRMYDLFGVKGITPAGIKNEDTVRGKIITKGLDTDRIGGGITEYLEQFADDAYNWVVQLLYVYDDIFSQFPEAKIPKLKVSVKEGSLLPKDATTKANQAIELANAGKMALIDLYKALEYPDPEDMAANVWLEANAPELLFKDNELVQEAMQMKAQQAAAMAQAAAQGENKPPSMSMSFKDLPPSGQAQMAQKVGITLGPEEIIANKDEEARKRIDEKKQGSDLLDKVPIQNGQG